MRGKMKTQNIKVTIEITETKHPMIIFVVFEKERLEFFLQKSSYVKCQSSHFPWKGPSLVPGSHEFVIAQ